MDYRETLEYIEQARGYGISPGLENIRMLLGGLGNPQDGLNVVHVAGTNGKGSVIAFLEKILMYAGYKVGAYTSPAVCEYREIIRINGEMIDERSVAEYFTQIRKIAECMKSEADMQPTLFEMETAMAFMHFAGEKCDIVLMETGMGGALDATNVVKSALCSVITSISMDHTQYLGNLVGDIAEQKAGIIKEGCPVVLGIQEEDYEREVLTAVQRKAREKHSAVVITERGGHFDLGVKGVFQQYNAALAVRTVSALRKKGYVISDGDVARGLKDMRWQCRFETVRENPRIILDGAHNPGAAKTLADSVEMYFTNEFIVFIMGVLADKDYRGIIERTARLADRIITVTPDSPRALDGNILADEIRKINKNVVYASDLDTAVDMAVSELISITGVNKDVDGKAGLDEAKSDKPRNGVIVAFGSLSYLGAVRDIVNKKFLNNSDE